MLVIAHKKKMVLQSISLVPVNLEMSFNSKNDRGSKMNAFLRSYPFTNEIKSSLKVSVFFFVFNKYSEEDNVTAHDSRW